MLYRKSLVELPEPNRLALEVDCAAIAGMLPSVFAQEIEGGLLAKDPEAQVDAAKRFAIVDDRITEDGGEVRTTEIRRGDEPAELGTLPFKPGDGSVRELLRPVAAGRQPELAGTKPVGGSKDAQLPSEAQGAKQDGEELPEGAIVDGSEQQVQDGESGLSVGDPALEAEIARQPAGDEIGFTGASAGADPEAVKAIEDFRRLNEQGLGKLLLEEGRSALQIVAGGRPWIDGMGRAAVRSRARDILTLKLDEARTLQGRQAERDALGTLSSVGQELSEVAGRRPNDIAVLRENSSRRVRPFKHLGRS